MEWKILLNWDFWGSLGYAIGQLFLFVAWLSVAYAILGTYDVPISKDSYYIAAVLGGLGSYWYAIRKYEKALR